MSEYRDHARYDRCSILGGRPDERNRVCWVGDFPAPLMQREWDKCNLQLNAQIDDKYTMVFYMSPEDAEKFLPALDYDIQDEDSLNNLIDRLRYGKPVCPAWRHLCKIERGGILEGLVLGHEGRHRVLASREVGLKSFPVVMLQEPTTSCEAWADDVYGEPMEGSL